MTSTLTPIPTSTILPNSYCNPINPIHEHRLLSIGQKLNHALNLSETIPSVFSQETAISQKQKQKIYEYSNALKSFKKIISPHHSPQLNALYNNLKRKVIALKYRLEYINDGLDPVSLFQIDEMLLQQLLPLAESWKQNQILNPKRNLSSRDLEKIKTTCRYPKFARLLLKDHSLQNLFFNWILRDNNSVSTFVEFPHTCSKIEQASLTARIGRFGENTLCIKKKKSQNPSASIKILTLPFFNGHRVKRLNILDENKSVTLNGDYNLSIKEIFNVFKNKMLEPGRLEFFGTQGIMNWNIHEHAWWDSNKKEYHRIDLTKEDWWKQLPAFEIINKEQIEDRYKVSLQPNEWVVAAMGSRVVLNLNLEESHGYLEIAMPLENGQYQIFDFGKFSAKYPLSTWEQLSFLTDTVIGRIAYPDENPFYSHRQHAKFPLVLNEQEGMRLMDLLKNEIIKAHSNNVIFQFAGENCAFWVQSLLQTLFSDRVPNLYKIYLLDVHPSHPALGKIFKVFRRAPKILQRTIIRVFDRCLGSHRQLAITENGQSKFKSLMTTPSRNEQSIFTPGLLHQQIEEGKLTGTIAFGL